jgi:LysM repeat protein
MTLRRILPLLTMMLLLAGCYRQADDSFQTVNSQAGEVTQPIPVTPTEVVEIIDPNAGSETPTPEGAAASPEAIESPAATVEVIQVDQPTATIVIIEPPTEAPTEAVETEPTTLPTATPPTLITPDLGNPLLVTLPTATPTVETTPVPGANGLQPTPTDLAGVEPGECDYVIVTGDNLYRIALNHGVELAALLAENQLSETSVIQPGESLKIPGCVASGESATAVPTTAGNNIPQGTPLPSDVVVHTVASGETLTTIARQYGVSLQSIIDANNLTNPDRLAVGDELVIPAGR